MAKPGRKRLTNVARYPSGQAKPEGVRPHRQRIADYARMMADKYLSTPLGHLKHAGTIDDRMYDAGIAYREAREAAEAALSLSPLLVRGQNLSAGGGAFEGEETPMGKERKMQAVKRLDGLMAAVGSQAALDAMDYVVCRDHPPLDWVQVLVLKAALRRLVAYGTARR